MKDIKVDLYTQSKRIQDLLLSSTLYKDTIVEEQCHIDSSETGVHQYCFYRLSASKLRNFFEVVRSAGYDDEYDVRESESGKPINLSSILL